MLSNLPKAAQRAVARIDVNRVAQCQGHNKYSLIGGLFKKKKKNVGGGGGVPICCSVFGRGMLSLSGNPEHSASPLVHPTKRISLQTGPNCPDVWPALGAAAPLTAISRPRENPGSRI